MTDILQIVANGGAGAMADAETRAAFERMVQETLPNARVTFIEEGGDIMQVVKDCIDRGATTMIAAGGDGTVNAVASHVVNTAMTLGVIPMGTLNHFSHDLGIPVETADALRVIAAGQAIQVDVGAVNDRIFLNNSGLGLYPDMVHNRERRQRRGWSKWPAVIWESFRAFVRYRRLRLQIQVNGENLNRRTPSVFVGNNEYTVSDGIGAERASLQEGVLGLYIPHTHSRLGLVWFALRALFGQLKADHVFDKLRTQAFTVRSRHRTLRVSIDGEVMRVDTPLAYHIRPAALRVLVPAPFSAGANTDASSNDRSA